MEPNELGKLGARFHHLVTAAISGMPEDERAEVWADLESGAGLEVTESPDKDIHVSVSGRLVAVIDPWSLSVDRFSNPQNN